jgi:hypothetical protein
MAATAYMLDRGWGKAPEKLQLTGVGEAAVRIEVSNPDHPGPAELFRLMVEETRIKQRAEREAAEAALIAKVIEHDAGDERGTDDR